MNGVSEYDCSGRYQFISLDGKRSKFADDCVKGGKWVDHILQKMRKFVKWRLCFIRAAVGSLDSSGLEKMKQFC